MVWYLIALLIIILHFNTYFPKKVTNADLFPIDDAIISFKSAFDKINDLLKPSTFIDIWNYIWHNNKKSLVWKEQLRHPQQRFVQFALPNYWKKLLSDFTRESSFL